jgi:hypothetical protein
LLFNYGCCIAGIRKRAETFNHFAERISVELLSPFLQILKKVRSNESSNIELFLLLSTSDMDGNYFIVDAHGSPALAWQSTHSIGKGKLLRRNKDDSVLASLSILTEDKPFSIFVKGVEVASAAVRKTVNLESGLFVAVNEAMLADHREGKVLLEGSGPSEPHEGVVILHSAVGEALLILLKVSPRFNFDVVLRLAIRSEVELKSSFEQYIFLSKMLWAAVRMRLGEMRTPLPFPSFLNLVRKVRAPIERWVISLRSLLSMRKSYSLRMIFSKGKFSILNIFMYTIQLKS